jgi:hypothetical protein
MEFQDIPLEEENGYKKSKSKEEEEQEDVINQQPNTPVFDLELNYAAHEDSSAWSDAYQNLMENSINQFHTLLSYKTFKLVDTKDDACLYERENGMSHGFYTWKVTKIMNVYADRLLHVIKDFNKQTRMQWDSDQYENVDELETFITDHGQIKVYKSEEKYNLPLFWNRVYLGIGWKHFNKRTNTYKFVFRTTQHRLFKCTGKKVNVICLFGVIIRILDDPCKCECIIINYINPGESVPTAVVNILRTRFFERIFLYEKVTKDWNLFYAKKK